MPSSGWTLDLARQWVAPERVRWRRWALLAATGLAFGASVLGDSGTRCSLEDPSVCGPDLTFSLSVVLAIASAVLLWWRPWVAAGCAVAFAALDLAYDDVWAANVAWPLVALLHVAHVATLARAAASQRRLAERATVSLPPWPPAPAAGASSAAAPPGLAHAGVVALLVVGLGCAGMLVRAERSDAAHAARSVLVTGRVAGFTDDDLVEVRLDGAVPGLPEVVEVDPLDPYDVGDEMVLRADPSDPGWTHPAAEPPDPTWWASLALGAALLAVVLAERLVTARMRRGLFLAHPPTTGVPVRCAVDDGALAVVACVDRDVVFADLPLVPVPDLPEAGPLGESLRPAYLVGDVRHGGWCALATAEGMLLPEAPLSAWPDLPRAEEVEEESGGDPRDWSSPVPEASAPAALPVRLGPTAADRWLGGAAVVGATAFGAWVLDPESAGWFSGLLILATCLEVAYWGANRAVSAVTIDATVVSLTSALRRLTVPLRAIEEVRCTPTHVVLLGEDDDELEIGPFGGGVVGRHSDDPRGGPEPTGPSAAEVAAAVDHARVAAGSVEAVGDARAGARWRLGAGVPVLLVAALVLVVRYLMAIGS